MQGALYLWLAYSGYCYVNTFNPFLFRTHLKCIVILSNCPYEQLMLFEERLCNYTQSHVSAQDLTRVCGKIALY